MATRQIQGDGSGSYSGGGSSSGGTTAPPPVYVSPTVVVGGGVPVGGVPDIGQALGYVNVQDYGLIGDGTLRSITRLAEKAAACTPGSRIIFPPSATGYQVGTSAELDLPAGVDVSGVARVGRSAVYPFQGATPPGLAIRPDVNGYLSALGGHVLDGGGGRVLWEPHVNAFPGNIIPGAMPGELLMVVMLASGSGTRICILQSQDYGASWVQGPDIVNGAAGPTTYIDPHMIRLSNGNLLCAFHESTANKVNVYRSTDGGKTWAARTAFGPAAGQYFSEPFLLAIRTSTGVSQQVLALCCDHDPTHARDTVYRTFLTTDEAGTWTYQGPITPAAGASSAGLLDDGTRGAMVQDNDGWVQVFYSRKVQGQAAEIWQERINYNGNNPSGAPQLVTTVPLIAGNAVGMQVGPFPVVLPSRRGGYVLYFSGCNYENGGDTGELYFMESTTAARGTWQTKRRICSVKYVTGGYGRIWPCRMWDGRVELVHVAVPNNIGGGTQIKSVVHYGV